MLRPDGIASPAPAWAFTSSFHLQGHPLTMSDMTRVNNQSPRPHLHRLDRQPYRLQTKSTKNLYGKGTRPRSAPEKLRTTALKAVGSFPSKDDGSRAI